MLEFFEQYGANILTLIIALTGAATSIKSFVDTIKLSRSVKLTQSDTMQQVQITREGIVEAFKTAKIPTEWKISISNQVDQKLEAWAEKFLTMFEEHERIRTELAVANTKILAYTAAFNKLTPEEKEHIEELIKQVTEKDKIIEVA